MNPRNGLLTRIRALTTRSMSVSISVLRERREEVTIHLVLFSNMGASRHKREDIFEEEYNRFMEEVSISELPVYLLDMYGVPHIDNPPLEDITLDDKCKD
jgi:hypothetical protein